MADEHILIEREGPLGWLIINRPEKLNAMNSGMWRAIVEGLHELEGDTDIRVILVRGAGEQAFSAGADITELRERLDAPRETAVEGGATERALLGLAHSSKPTIGVIQGPCLGGGCAIALALDLRIASEAATFGLTPARLGIGYPLTAIERTVQELGPGAARLLLVTGRILEAERAYELGLVHEVHEAKDLIPAAYELGTTVARNAPKTIRAVLEGVRQAVMPDAERDRTKALELIRACFASEDYREGLEAFLSRRKPEFRDR